MFGEGHKADKKTLKQYGRYELTLKVDKYIQKEKVCFKCKLQCAY